MFIKIAIIAILILILASLFFGAFFLVKDESKSKRMISSLTVRVTLSVILFILLLVGYFTGAIQPHGLHP